HAWRRRRGGGPAPPPPRPAPPPPPPRPAPPAPPPPPAPARPRGPAAGPPPARPAPPPPDGAGAGGAAPPPRTPPPPGDRRRRRAPGELGRVPGLVREQRLVGEQRVPLDAGHDDVPEGERGRRGDRQPVPVPDQQAVTAAGEPGPPGHRHQHPGQGRPVDQV